MTDDTLKITLERYDALQRHLRPLSLRIDALQFNDGVGRLIEEASRTSNLLRTASARLKICV